MSKRFQKTADKPRAAAAPPKPRKKTGPPPFTVGLRPQDIAARQAAPVEEDDGIAPPAMSDRVQMTDGQSFPVEHCLEMLGQMWATTKEVSAFLRITEKTLFKLFRNEPRAKELYERGKLMGNVSQRRRNISLADKGNPAMNIFLSKNQLGMRDNFEVTGHVDHQHAVLVTLYQQIAGNHGKTIEGEAPPPPPMKVIQEMR